MTDHFIWEITALLLHAVVGPLAAGHALLYKRDPRAATGWLAVCLLFPLAGPISYVLFGVNRVQTRARALRGTKRHWLRVPYEGQSTPVSFQPAHRAPENEIHDATGDAIDRVSLAVSGRAAVGGNRIRALENGEEAFPAMLAAINAAKRSVRLMTYIFETNKTGREFIEALSAARERGVDVRVLTDGAGDWYSCPRASKALRKAGIPVARFLPVRLFPPALHLNLRNHRKALVVDGWIGFAGGMNIGDRHLMSSGKRATQDLHFEVLGPVAAQLEKAFIAQWTFATGEALAETAMDPVIEGDAQCRVIEAGPDDDMGRLVAVLLGAIAAARREIQIVTPYFLPPRELVAAIQVAALRGVAVSIVLPAVNNLKYVHWATRNMLWELLERGAAVYYQPPPFAHSKLFVVDRKYVQLGSANLDARSLRLNFELALEVFHDEFGERSAAYIDRLIARSRPLSLREIDARSIPARLRDAFFWLFSPYL